MKLTLMRSLTAVAVLASAAAVAQTDPAPSSAALPAAPSSASSSPSPVASTGGSTKIGTINIEAAIFASNEGQRDGDAVAKKLEPKQTELKTMNDELEGLKTQLKTQGDKMNDEAKYGGWNRQTCDDPEHNQATVNDAKAVRSTPFSKTCSQSREQSRFFIFAFDGLASVAAVSVPAAELSAGGTPMFSGLAAVEEHHGKRWTAVASFAMQGILVSAALILPLLHPGDLSEAFARHRIFVPVTFGDTHVRPNQ